MIIVKKDFSQPPTCVDSQLPAPLRSKKKARGRNSPAGKYLKKQTVIITQKKVALRERLWAKKQALALSSKDDSEMIKNSQHGPRSALDRFKRSSSAKIYPQ